MTGAPRALDRWQRRHGAPAFVLAVVRKYLDDRGAGLAALIAFYAFFSVFPLLLVFVSVLGFVLQDDPALREKVVDSALAQLPIVGAQLGDEVQPLQGSHVALAVGLAGALWAGLGVTLALGRAFDAVADVPRLEQRTGLRARGRGLLVLGVLAVVLIGVRAARRGAAFGLLMPPLALSLIVVLMLANKVGSPQFVTWLAAPVVLGLALRPRRFAVPAALTAAVAAFTHIIYPYWYGWLLVANPAFVLLLTMKSVLLVVLLAWSVRAVWRAGGIRRPSVPGVAAGVGDRVRIDENDDE